MKTRIISGFPGVGKTYFAQNSEYRVLDSDSSKWSKKEGWATNYVNFIREQQNLGSWDYILVSTHKEVREELVNQGLYFTLIIPLISSRPKYLRLYEERGSSVNFINLMKEQWIPWITDCRLQEGSFKRVHLSAGESVTSWVTHDIVNKLRNKLSPVANLIEMLQDDVINITGPEDLVEIIKDEIDRAKRAVDSLVG